MQELLRIPYFTVADSLELIDVLRAQACVDAGDWQYESPPWENGCKDFGRWNTIGRADVKKKIYIYIFSFSFVFFFFFLPPGVQIVALCSPTNIKKKKKK